MHYFSSLRPLFWSLFYCWMESCREVHLYILQIYIYIKGALEELQVPHWSFLGHDCKLHFVSEYTPFLWMASEEFWPHHLLSLSRKHRPDWLHHCLAWQMLLLQARVSPESGENSDAHHRLQTHSLKGHLPVMMPKHQGLPSYNRLQTHFLGCHLAGGNRASNVFFFFTCSKCIDFFFLKN